MRPALRVHRRVSASLLELAMLLTVDDVLFDQLGDLHALAPANLRRRAEALALVAAHHLRRAIARDLARDLA